MEGTQSFRLIGTEDIVDIALEQINGQNVIFWEDIEDVFHKVKSIRDGRVAINKLRDSNHNRYYNLYDVKGLRFKVRLY